MKKEKYETPAVEIIEFETEDMIVTSPPGGDNDENEENELFLLGL